jgi:Glyoxalase-like domain
LPAIQAAVFGSGLEAGPAGTAAVTVSSTLERRLNQWFLACTRPDAVDSLAEQVVMPIVMPIVRGRSSRTLMQPACRRRPTRRPACRSSQSGAPVTYSSVSLRWDAAVVDCHDAVALSRWWAEVLGWQIAHENDDEVVVLPPHLVDTTRQIAPAERGPGLLFQPVPKECQVRNRLYLTLAPSKGDSQQAEIRRLEAMGAKVIAVGEGSVDWVIMEDPEGNGFSVLSPRN